MKKSVLALCAVISTMTMLAGCSWQVGSCPKTATIQPTTGQQLIDLQRAKDTGAVTEAEYHAQKAKLLGTK